MPLHVRLRFRNLPRCLYGRLVIHQNWASHGRCSDAERISPLFRIVHHALKINYHDGFVTDNPRIVTAAQHGNLSRFDVPLCSIVCLNVEDTGKVILKMRGLATFCLDHRLE